MTSPVRTALLTQLAAAIATLELGRPVRIAVDGRTASGKTTISDELATLIRLRCKEVIRASIDSFHRPKRERYARGRYSAEGYYYDGRDLPAIRSLLLDPLGPHGNRLYRTASFDLVNDRPIQQEAQTASPNAILIVDGTFLQRSELRSGWDVIVFIEVSEHLSEQRGVNRDADGPGRLEATRQLYANRYRPAFDLYQRLCAPASSADVLLNNEDLSQPRMRIREDGSLSGAWFYRVGGFDLAQGVS